MMLKNNRRKMLRLAGATTLALPFLNTRALADKPYPSQPITLINPNPPAGYNDNLGRLISTPLGSALGQPVTVINVPGASELLGHEYFLKEPDNGNYLLVTAASFIPLNIILQKAPFKIDDFSMINLPARDYTLLATSSGGSLKSVNDVISALKKDPTSISIGVPRASTDYINVILFAQAINVDPKKFATGDPLKMAAARAAPSLAASWIAALSAAKGSCRYWIRSPPC